MNWHNWHRQVIKSDVLLVQFTQLPQMDITNSSWISSIRSNGALSKHIDLTTKTGKTYTYEVAGDSTEFIQKVRDAESVGAFVNKCFKDETLTRVDV